jgi:ribosome recycling factor
MSDQAKAKMTAAIEHFKTALKNIRTGRANPGMVEHIMVEVYGNPTPLKNIASISTPEARQLLITPFDPKQSQAIGKAIEKSNLGIMPIVDGNSIRLKIPPMTEEIRKKMVKICHEERERAKITVRNIRGDENKVIRKQKADGLIAEDIMKKTEKSIQDLTDKSCKEIDDLSEKKEKEIFTI